MRYRLDRTLLHRLLLVVTLGGATAGCLLTAYAWGTAIPATMIGETTDLLPHGPIQAFGLDVAVAVVVMAAVVTAHLRPHMARRLSTGFLFGVIPLTLLGVFFTMRLLRQSIDFANGPGSQSTAPYAVVGLACALVSVVAACGAFGVRADRTATLPTRAGCALGAAALVLVAAALAHGFATSSPKPRTEVAAPLAATSISSPSTPSRVAYRLRFGLTPADYLVRIGSGVVVRERGAIVAYDGATGAERWSVPTTKIDADSFAEDGYRNSTMIAVESPRGPVVAVIGSQGRLTVLDALNGSPLWWTSDDVSLVATTGQTYSDALVVMRHSVTSDNDPINDSEGPRNLVSLDPRTGDVRWSQPQPTESKSDSCYFNGDISGSTMLFTNSCDRDRTPRYIDVRSGATTRATWPNPSTIEQITAIGERFELRTGFDSRLQDSRHFLFSTKPENVAPVELPSGAVSNVSNGRLIAQFDDQYRLIDSQTSIVAPLPTISSTRSTTVTGSQLIWVGDTAAGAFSVRDARSEQLGFVTMTGATKFVDSPCISDSDSVRVLPVSGALLVVCVRGNYQQITELVGLT